MSTTTEPEATSAPNRSSGGSAASIGTPSKVQARPSQSTSRSAPISIGQSERPGEAALTADTPPKVAEGATMTATRTRPSPASSSPDHPWERLSTISRRIGPSVTSDAWATITAASLPGSATLKMAGRRTIASATTMTATRRQPIAARRSGTGSSIRVGRMQLDEGRAGAVVEQRPVVPGAAIVDPPPHERGVPVQPEGRRDAVDQPAECGEAPMRAVVVVVQVTWGRVGYHEDGFGALCGARAPNDARPHAERRDLHLALAVDR